MKGLTTLMEHWMVPFQQTWTYVGTLFSYHRHSRSSYISCTHAANLKCEFLAHDRYHSRFGWLIIKKLIVVLLYFIEN